MKKNLEEKLHKMWERQSTWTILTWMANSLDSTKMKLQWTVVWLLWIMRSYAVVPDRIRRWTDTTEMSIGAKKCDKAQAVGSKQPRTQADFELRLPSIGINGQVAPNRYWGTSWMNLLPLWWSGRPTLCDEIALGRALKDGCWGLIRQGRMFSAACPASWMSWGSESMHQSMIVLQTCGKNEVKERIWVKIEW